MKGLTISLAPLMLSVFFGAGCGGATEDQYNPVINPTDFVAEVDNPYFPLQPGTTFVYQGQTEEGTERNEVVITDKAKSILGVTAVVVWDRVWLNDLLIEETFDWYAQDKEGNVWYFGEEVNNYKDGVLKDHAGAWEAGVAGAKPGIIMKAAPRVGDTYRQEYYKGEAEDMADVLSLAQTVLVPWGSFTKCLETRDWTPLDPGHVEHKYYAPGIGLVLETLEGGSERVELVEVKTA